MVDGTGGTVNLLVKASGPVIGTPLALGLNGPSVRFEFEPLFKSIGRPSGLAAGAEGPAWHLVKTQLPAPGVSQWQLCHELLDKGDKFAEGGVTFAEPDLEQ